MPKFMEWVVDIFSYGVTIAALVIGAAIVLMAGVLLLFVAWRLLTHWANRLAERVIGMHTLAKAQRLYAEAEQGALVGLDRVSRVEVIDLQGRSYAKWGLVDVKASWQDEGRTLKLFLKEETDEEGI